MINWQQVDWKRVAKVLIISFVILLIFYFSMDKIIMPIYTRHGQAIRVPDLTNLFYEDAREQVNRLNLQIVEETKKFDPSNEFQIGSIMAQNPRSGSTVKKGRRIYVVVSKGEPLIEMPDLRGRSERNAVFMIKNLGLELRHIHYDHSDFYHEGVVSGQNVPTGSEIKFATSIDIIVSAGRLPDQFITPNVIGRSLNEAQKIIIQAGLRVGQITYRDEDDLLPETVLQQSIEADQQVNRGDALDLVVSKLPNRDN